MTKLNETYFGEKKLKKNVVEYFGKLNHNIS